MNIILFVSYDEVFLEDVVHRAKGLKIRPVAAHDIHEAFSQLANESIEVIVTDIPSRDESEAFLADVARMYPNCIRINLAATSFDYLTNIDASKKTNNFKNLESGELFSLIMRIIDLNAHVRNKDLINSVSNLQHLPTIPKTYHELNDMIAESRSIDEISNKLEEDPAVTSNILKLANSAFYNAKTGSIRQAVMYIGLTNVKNIILTNAVFGNTGLSTELRDLHWEHVSITNKLLNAIYIELLGKKLNNNLSAVGLLHDVGSIVLMSNYPKDFNEIITEVRTNHVRDVGALEKERFGFSHEEIGSHLLDLWGLPYPIIEVALYHNQPCHKGVINRELVQCVYLADYYAWKMIKQPKPMSQEHHDVLFELGIHEEAIESLCQKMLQKM